VKYNATTLRICPTEFEKFQRRSQKNLTQRRKDAEEDCGVKKNSEERRKLASYEVAGFLPDKMRPERTLENAMNSHARLTGRNG